MFLKKQLSWNVVIPAKDLDTNGLMLQKAVILRLLENFAEKKATKEFCYFMALTTLDEMGKGKVLASSGDVLFPVKFSCITFEVFRGEIVEGVVSKILKQGVLLRSGPVENMYLSHQKMADCRYVPGENPFFMNDKLSKIEKDVLVRCIVMEEKYKEATKEIFTLVSLEGDYLGPIWRS